MANGTDQREDEALARFRARLGLPPIHAQMGRFHAEATGRLALRPERRVTAAGSSYVAAALLSTEAVEGGYMHIWVLADGCLAEQVEALSVGAALSVAGDAEVIPRLGRRPAALCITADSMLLLRDAGSLESEPV
jgi:hypothetical protein